MPFEFVCPHCHNRTKELDQIAGQSGPCSSCGNNVVMPHFNAQGVLVPTIALPPKSKPQTLDTKKRGWMPTVVGAAIVFFLVSFFATSLLFLWPRIRQNMQRSAQSLDLENMQLLATALNEYSVRYGTYPTPVVLDAQGKQLYSWRVLILPFLGHEELYKRFDLKQPWDSVANSNLHREMPPEFASPNSMDAAGNYETNYALITGAGTLFPPSGPMSPKNIDQPTLLLIETKNNTTWCAPGDIDVGRSFKVGNKPMVDVGGLHQTSFTAMTVDEQSFRMPSDVPLTVLNALVSPNGGENVQTSTFKE